jgi:nucleotide-binding universal stress UspA family protein
MSKKILVALDNSDYAEKVMLQAVEMANAYKASLVGVSSN